VDTVRVWCGYGAGMAGVGVDTGVMCSCFQCLNCYNVIIL